MPARTPPLEDYLLRLASRFRSRLMLLPVQSAQLHSIGYRPLKLDERVGSSPVLWHQCQASPGVIPGRWIEDRVNSRRGTQPAVDLRELKRTLRGSPDRVEQFVRVLGSVPLEVEEQRFTESFEILSCRTPCLPRPVFKITICDLRDSHSDAVSSNTKSDGKRLRLRRMAWLRALVLTP